MYKNNLTLTIRTSLTAIDVSDNLFTGSVPIELCDLTRLNTFISCNPSGCSGLSGCIPLCLASIVQISNYGSQQTCSLGNANFNVVIPMIVFVLCLFDI
jgi:hypothetical protein